VADIAGCLGEGIATDECEGCQYEAVTSGAKRMIVPERVHANMMPQPHARVDAAQPKSALWATMFVPSTFAVALVMTILSTICWGSFANTFKGTKNYRFELYYWDYALGIFLIAVLLALTMGSFAGGPTAFLPNLREADGLNLFYAAVGGFIF